MKRAVSLLMAALMLALSLLGFAACDRSYDEEEVRKEAMLLIVSSARLNEIYWGKGISYIEDASNSSGAYYPADPAISRKYGFETIEGLRSLTRSVFSKKYSELIFATRLSPITDEGGVRVYARYYQKYYDAEEKEPQCIMVYSLADVLLVDQVEYMYDSLKVSHSEGDVVYVTLTVNVTRDGKTQKCEMKVGLVEEDEGWRISTPTYMTYNEKLNDYEKLQ